ncbi:acylphosphatase [Radiobacillus kanasensis]|uniref:acylphosphatase n=1 Tax=Radiobacillus kanasensis TaxID=2844358 RepID=UPI001E311506|nr:acylphosphatase [Radiobacillus kanasensis]UFU01230.1 acylphosphatase [Radiobacillus kanasensis]
MISQHIIVHGRVQGVGFRATAQMKAKTFGLTGWVRNLEDGCVEMIVEGSEANVETFKSTVKEGLNRFTRVDRLDVTDNQELKGFKNFQIKY